MCIYLPAIAFGWTANIANEWAQRAVPQQGQCVKALTKVHVQ